MADALGGADRQDQLVLAGLLRNEHEASALIDSLSAIRDGALKAEREASQAERERLEVEIEAAGKEAEVAEATIEAITLERQQLKSKVREIEERLSALSNCHQLLFSDLVARRATYRLRLLEGQLDQLREQSRKLGSDLIEEEKQRLEYDRANHEKVQVGKESFTAELERRQRDLEGRKKEATERLSEVDGKLASLRQLGVTSKTSGFLVWAGYLGFTAFGWYFGQVLRRLQADLSWIRDFLSLLLGAMSGLVERFGPGWGALILFGFPLLLWLLALGILWVGDTLMRRADGGWSTASSRRTRADQAGQQRRSSLTWWLHSPLRRVRREDYLEWAARTPLLVLSAELPLVVLFLLVLGRVEGVTPGVEGIPQPWQSFYFTFLGIALMITLGGAAILYCARVVEPRYEQLYRSGSLTAGAALKSNAELVALVGIVATLLVGGELLRLAYPSWPSMWAADNAACVLLLGGLNALLLAYGLVFRGQFKDRRALEREIQGYEEALQHHSGLPERLLGEEDSDRFSQKLEELRETLKEAWEESMASATASGRGGRLFSRWRGTARTHEVEVHPLFVPGDALLEPDLVQEIKELRSQKGELDAQREGLQRRLDELSQEEAGAGDPSELRKRQLDLLYELEEKQRRNKARRMEIELQFAGSILAGETAFRLGQTVRDDLDREE